MENKQIVKHIKMDFIFSALILFSLSFGVIVFILGCIIEDSHKAMYFQLANILISAIVSAEITRKFYRKLDMFLHKYIYKKYI